MDLLIVITAIASVITLNQVLRLTRQSKPHKAGYTATFRISVCGFSIEGDDLKMNMKPNQQFSAAAVNFRDNRDQPATPQSGSAVPESTNPAAFSVELDPDNEFGVIVKGNPEATGSDSDVGIARLTIDGDPDPSIESKIVLEVAVNITPRAAVIADFEAGPVTDQPGVS
jgi:hypothetical protein